MECIACKQRVLSLRFDLQHDEAIGMTTFTLQKEGFYVAINLNVDFLRPGILGETITAETNIIRDGRNLCHAECKVFNEQGVLIAKASSNLMLTQIKKS